MDQPIEMSEVRREIINQLYTELVGPKESEEVIEQLPTVRYSSGILYPSNSENDALQNQYGGDEEDGEEIDAIPVQFNRPASIGISCLVIPELGSIKCLLDYGRYEDLGDWKFKRIPFHAEHEIHLVNGGDTLSLDNDLRLEWVVQRREDHIALHVFVVNRKRAGNDFVLPDHVFQPTLRLESHRNENVFLDMEVHTPVPSLDPDVESFRLLYRNKGEFATGHNCAADWTTPTNHLTREVHTTFVPTYELPIVEHRDIPGMNGLNMEVLASCQDGDEFKRLLIPLVYEYRSWVGQQRESATVIESRYQEVAFKHIDQLESAVARILQGIELISQDPQIREAFRFANQVMLYQRSYSVWAAKYRQMGERVEKTPSLQGKWRPFQLAFILLNIAGLSDPQSVERDVVDLLWFPTGGGKTEAYLGLSAFTLGLRRLRGKWSNPATYAGTAVLMRYTLRLLTIQQFQRATTMICACEVIRRKDVRKWGNIPFYIGLWVGSKTTPNTLDDAGEALDNLSKGKDVAEGNPVQLHHCPWCGEELSYKDYHIEPDNSGLRIRCPRAGCEFYSNIGIPALTVDEDVYRRSPSLLIGTVDKFARLPLNNKMGAIFGLVDQYCERHGFIFAHEDHPKSHRAKHGLNPSVTVPLGHLLPPELIIQDELHLISGPLGTMVGLYESAIDTLSVGTKGVRPKVIASTATIRRANDQIRQLFARESFQFPPAGLDVSDNFFATEEPTDKKPGRLYVGVYLPGNSTQTNEINVYSTLLQAAQDRKDSEYIDPYWTVVGYYNSLRELGGALRLFEDDIPDKLKYYARKDDSSIRYLNRKEELTSRRSSDDIPKILTQLEKNKESGQALDAILATNIISVGVDVERIGLMVVNGQPKGTSEYIQSSSRVGRRYPGLVVTIYNWMRPRDISHYERFISYHSMLYRYVEATSVTPFSPRARDKGLRAIFVGMLRQLDSELTENAKAGLFRRDRPTISGVIEGIKKRVLLTEPMEWPIVEQELDQIMSWWENMSTSYGQELKYSRGQFVKRDEEVPTLLRSINEREFPGSELVSDSLREVEKEALVVYKR